MAEMQTLTITLPIELAVRVNDAVETGDFRSPHEVVLAALRDWTDARAPRSAELVSLKADIADGLADIEAGHVEDFDVDRIIALGRQLSADRSRSA